MKATTMTATHTPGPFADGYKARMGMESRFSNPYGHHRISEMDPHNQATQWDDGWSEALSDLAKPFLARAAIDASILEPE